MLLVNTYFNFVLLVNTEKIVLLTNEVFLIKCCCRIKKTKLTRECCDSHFSVIWTMKSSTAIELRCHWWRYSRLAMEYSGTPLIIKKSLMYPRCRHWPRSRISPGLAGVCWPPSGILGNGILLLLSWKRARGGVWQITLTSVPNSWMRLLTTICWYSYRPPFLPNSSMVGSSETNNSPSLADIKLENVEASSVTL